MNSIPNLLPYLLLWRLLRLRKIIFLTYFANAELIFEEFLFGVST